MYEWLHWAIFNASFDGLEQLSEARKVLLEECMELIERRAGVQIPDGSNPSAKPMTLTLDRSVLQEVQVIDMDHTPRG